MRALFLRIEPYLTPLLAFSGLYFASLIVLSLIVNAVAPDPTSLLLNHLSSFVATIAATTICVISFEKERWDLGVFVSPRVALRGMARGVAAGAIVVGSTHLIILVTSDYHSIAGSGIDWVLILTLILPAAFGEELLFRGYVLQKLYRTSPEFAVLVTSLLFALAHGRNPAIGLLSFMNILLAGVLLALMWAWDGSLWMPTWGHIAWNVISGPVLGHETSGIDLGPTLLSEVDPGPAWLTGGEFGIEASVVLTLIELLAIWILGARIRSRDHALRDIAREAPAVPGPDA